MKRRFGVMAVVVLGLVTACGGGEEELAFPVETADDAAHEALLAVDELPGEGWEVTAEDDFGDDGDSFVDAMDGVPECEPILELDGLADALSGGDDDAAGRAQVEFTRADETALLPETMELQVTIQESVARIQEPWELMRDAVESGDLGDCMVEALPKAVLQDAPPGLEVTVDEREPSAEVPDGGVAIGFDVAIAADGLEANMAIELYLWPRGNAGVTANFGGPAETLDAGTIETVLEDFADAVAAAEG